MPSEPDSQTQSAHAEPIEKVLDHLDVNPVKGLKAPRIEDSRKKYGSNEIRYEKRTGTLDLIADSARQPMIILLLSIAAISLLSGRYPEAGFMAFIVIAYVLVEFINKSRTERVMSELREVTKPDARVIRDGKLMQIPIESIVVGDIMVLMPGSIIHADGRLISSAGMRVNEASLTGESKPSLKNAYAIHDIDTPVRDRDNSVFAGTVVVDGEGKAVITAVGKKSEYGKIAASAKMVKKEKTMLQVSMTGLAKILTVLAVSVSILIPLVGLLRGYSPEQMLLTWLALTFLMVPGQPPIIIQMSLALASYEMAGKKIIVKRLQGAESMGFVTAVLTDKTGTITENRMRVERYVLPDGNSVRPDDLSLETGRMISLSLPEYGSDPTDRAIAESISHLTAGEAFGPVNFRGFSRGTPWRAITYRADGKYLHVISGSPEALISSSTSDVKKRDMLRDISMDLASAGKRVTAIAYVQNEEQETCSISDLEIAALTVIDDPVRPGVRGSIRTLADAGISTMIVTGDHPDTAKSIAESVGLNTRVMTGDEIRSAGDSELADTLERVSVYSRVEPFQKLRLVKVLQSRNEEVAFIGDGTNDVPAIRSANIGLAMGESGTDMAKQTADLVLVDDDFNHTVDTVRIARKAIDNFRKGLTYYLSAKTILLSVFIVPLALGIPFPFSPIHIIMIELLMDLASSTIFVTEAPEPDIMDRPSFKAREIVNIGMAGDIIRNGAPLAAGIMAIYLWIYYGTGDLVLAQTAALCTWLSGHILLALNLKQRKTPLLDQGLLSNKFGALWLSGMVLLIVLITEATALHPYLNTAQVPLYVWAVIAVIATASTFWIEMKKRFDAVHQRAV